MDHYILTSSSNQPENLKKKKQDESTFKFCLPYNTAINDASHIEILNLKTFYLMMIITSN